MKQFILLIILFTICSPLRAVIACPEPVTVQQPDGTNLTIKLHGDEYLNFHTTLDGYTVIKSEKTGAWEYADIAESQLISSNITAHNAEERTLGEKQFLKQTATFITPSPSIEQREMRQLSVSLRKQHSIHKLAGTKFDYSKFRGLVILVEFSDRSFTRNDAHDIFEAMINQPEYTGFNALNTNVRETYTGSVHDYFSDNSGGRFRPQFDVIGPIKINKSCTSPNGTSGASSVVQASLDAADQLIDFSNYDTDGDGVVDMVYFIFAGAGSNFSGNNSRFIWPHASATYGIRDGVRMGRYACSTELYGPLNNKIIDGIGTIVHEFSHVLGVADFYDTDYSGSGGESAHPGLWSVMASGSYNNYARTPVAYSAYERYANGFDNPELINEPAEYTLPYLGTSGKSYRVNSPVAHEFFIFENRQKSKWDAYLPGNGMLVFRVDSTNNAAWNSNRVNADPEHNYYELLRAMPTINASGTIVDGSGDPYPGQYRLKKLVGFKTWDGTAMPFSVSKISEVSPSDGGSIKDVRFTLGINNDVLFEDFENLPLTANDTTGINGRFTSWDLSGANIIKATETCGYGSHAVGLIKSGKLISTPIETPVKSLTFELSTPNNYGSNKAEIKVYIRSDQEEWNVLNTSDSLKSVSLNKNCYTRVTYPINNIKNAVLKFELCNGNESEFCYLDNILLAKGEESSGIESIEHQNTQKISVKAIGGKLIVEGAVPGEEIKLFSIDGRLIDRAIPDVTGRSILVSSRRGVFIIVNASSSLKVIV